MSEQPNRMPSNSAMYSKPVKWFIKTDDGKVTRYKNEKLYKADLRIIANFGQLKVVEHGSIT